MILSQPRESGAFKKRRLWDYIYSWYKQHTHIYILGTFLRLGGQKVSSPKHFHLGLINIYLRLIKLISLRGLGEGAFVFWRSMLSWGKRCKCGFHFSLAWLRLTFLAWYVLILPFSHMPGHCAPHIKSTIGYGSCREWECAWCLSQGLRTPKRLGRAPSWLVESPNNGSFVPWRKSRHWNVMGDGFQTLREEGWARSYDMTQDTFTFKQ